MLSTCHLRPTRLSVNACTRAGRDATPGQQRRTHPSSPFRGLLQKLAATAKTPRRQRAGARADRQAGGRHAHAREPSRRKQRRGAGLTCLAAGRPTPASLRPPQTMMPSSSPSWSLAPPATRRKRHNQRTRACEQGHSARRPCIIAMRATSTLDKATQALARLERGASSAGSSRHRAPSCQPAPRSNPMSTACRPPGRPCIDAGG